MILICLLGWCTDDLAIARFDGFFFLIRGGSLGVNRQGRYYQFWRTSDYFSNLVP